jgi:Domain of unknown function (DUF4390)
MLIPNRRPYSFAIALACVLCLNPLTALAGDILIESAQTRIENDVLLLDAVSRFEFSDDAIEALNSGIGLVIELDLKITRPRKYFWDRKILKVHRAFKVERHALSKKFVVTDRVTGDRHAHSELTLAIAELEAIKNLALFNATVDGCDEKCNAALRLRLDLESLPAPMIPLAYVSPDWHMSSGWYRWPITH